jgi:hypothetical protein
MGPGVRPDDEWRVFGRTSGGSYTTTLSRFAARVIPV